MPEIPPGLIRDQTTQDRLAFVWQRNPKAQNTNAPQAVDELIGFLRQNGVAVTAEMKLAIGDFADDFWCSLDPSRCPDRSFRLGRDVTPEKTIHVMDLPVMSMTFSKRFWELCNSLMASDQEDPAGEMDRLAKIGLALCKGDGGCAECAKHWQAHLESFPPLALIYDNPSARLWLWKSHNFSRQGKPPTPLQDIIKGWRWPAIKPQDAAAIIERMGMTNLP